MVDLKELERWELLFISGLNENNINDAVNSSNASVIDVSSGVESEPGLKDKKKIENFVKLTRLAYEKKL